MSTRCQQICNGTDDIGCINFKKKLVGVQFLSFKQLKCDFLAFEFPPEVDELGLYSPHFPIYVFSPVSNQDALPSFEV